MFADQFITEEIEKKPEYFLAGVGDLEAEREQLLENERREFERLTTHPDHLFIYHVVEGMHWKKVASLSYPLDLGGVAAYLDTNTGLVWFAGAGEVGTLPSDHVTLIEALPAGGDWKRAMAELTELGGPGTLVEGGVQPA